MEVEAGRQVIRDELLDALFAPSRMTKELQTGNA